MCEVCGLEVSRPEALLGAQRGLVVCRRGACQGLWAQRTTMDEAAYAVHFARGSRMIRDRHARDDRRQAHVDAVDAAEAADSQRILEAARQVVDGGDRLTALVIPSGLTRMAPTAPGRIQRYRAHLEEALEEAGRYPDVTAIPPDIYSGARDRLQRTEAHLEENPRLRARSEHACTLCKGGCCTTGEEHAYISALEIRRMLDADPTLTPERILETYLALVPDQGVADSCINQGATGCTLPREWRSDVCNGFFCPAVTDFQRQWDENDAPPTLVIRRAHHVWNRYLTTTLNPAVEVAVVDGDGIHPLGMGRDGEEKGIQPPPGAERHGRATWW